MGWLGLNNAGQVVGASTTKSGEVRAVLWEGRGRPIDLGVLGVGDPIACVAMDINEQGQVVGGCGVVTGPIPE